MFAKLFHPQTSPPFPGGQILFKLGEGAAGPEVRMFIEPPMLGVCEMALQFNDDKVTKDAGDAWDRALALFESIDSDAKALERAQLLLNQVAKMVEQSDGEKPVVYELSPSLGLDYAANLLSKLDAGDYNGLSEYDLQMRAGILLAKDRLAKVSPNKPQESAPTWKAEMQRLMRWQGVREYDNHVKYEGDLVVVKLTPEILKLHPEHNVIGSMALFDTAAVAKELVLESFPDAKLLMSIPDVVFKLGD